MTRKRQGIRQNVRKALLLISLLLFPVVLNYISPYLIIDGASQGVISGSFIVFTLLFVTALLAGRLWCGWLCPGGGLAEACSAVNGRPVRGGRWNWTKWIIWVVWLAIIAWVAAAAGGFRTVDFLHNTDSGISVDEPARYPMYYTIVGMSVLFSVVFGRRSFCHYLCWMAPFTILGRKIRNLFQWPALRLKTEQEKCIDCKRCTKTCPMSLNVNGMVQEGTMENSECILCGNCVDTCPQDVIRYSFSAGK